MNPPRILRRFHDDERGATVAIVAISLIALFGMIVLVVDVGGLLYKRRELVNGSDAAALAAARTCSVSALTDGANPHQVADDWAIQNVESLTEGDGGIVDGFETCRQPSGYLTVEYRNQQELFFAPVLGFGDSGFVTTRATAAWGALGGGAAVPIVLESSQFQGDCNVPDVAPDTECHFWYNNGNFAIGDANWGFLNLDQWGVDRDANCSSAGGAASRGDYIENNYPNQLTLADPGPTYVCSMTGHATDNWSDLIDRMESEEPGPVVLMPVNDCDAQVDKDGNVVPCGTGTPDKFAIIGFVEMELTSVLRGDDEEAIGTAGTPASSGSCGGNVQLGLGAGVTRQMNVVMDQDCGAPSVVDHIPYADIGIYWKQGNNKTYYAKCAPGGLPPACDYTYDESTFELIWVNPLNRVDGHTKLVEGTWSVDAIPGDEGKCEPPDRTSDPNALCVSAKWIGYDPGPGPIGTGPNFGPTAVILCDFAYGSCPE